MKQMSLWVFIMGVFPLFGQFSGKYSSFFNGDNIMLEIKQKDNVITGYMKDSQQNYTITAEKTEQGFEGSAVDEKIGITFLVRGTRTADGLDMDFDVDYEGNRTDAFLVNFVKEGKEKNTAGEGGKKGKKPIDKRIVGQWKHESFYSSGYGADAMSGSNVQYLAFNEDGTMTDMGNQANISGSNYSGNSGKGSGNGTVSNVWYYTKGNQIMVYTMVNGVEQEMPMGTYYIEDGKLLITATNGEKMLLQRVQ
jgi:hypothetical protein